MKLLEEQNNELASKLETIGSTPRLLNLMNQMKNFKRMPLLLAMIYVI
jgi:hypothetical protein